jgi:predicted dehydrogenase
MAITRSYQWQALDVGDAADQSHDDTGIIRVGLIGFGVMGNDTLKNLLAREDVAITALCDIDSERLAKAAAQVTEARGADTFECFHDFRELNRSESTDAVIVSTPDHWHALQGIDAMRSGKDVYIEKPLTLTIAEGRRISDVATETGRVCQTGSQQRSSREFRHACELIRNGHLGTLQSVDICIPKNNRTSDSVGDPEPVPSGFDYEMWLGPAPYRPYHSEGCHYAFRFISDFSGGQLTNWGAHNLDIVQWALGTDTSGPIRVQGTGSFPAGGLFDTPDDIDVTLEYANGVTVRCTTGGPHCRFVGSDGTLTVGRGHFKAIPASIGDITLEPDAIRLYRSDDHMGNFFECVRTRQQPVCPPETGHRSATVCHLANIAVRLGRPLEWDPAGECFINDDEANAMRSRPMRAPWSLD